MLLPRNPIPRKITLLLRRVETFPMIVKMKEMYPSLRDQLKNHRKVQILIFPRAM
jgi:hypothetical protein